MNAPTNPWHGTQQHLHDHRCSAAISDRPNRPVSTSLIKPTMRPRYIRTSRRCSLDISDPSGDGAHNRDQPSHPPSPVGQTLGVILPNLLVKLLHRRFTHTNPPTFPRNSPFPYTRPFVMRDVIVASCVCCPRVRSVDSQSGVMARKVHVLYASTTTFAQMYNRRKYIIQALPAHRLPANLHKAPAEALPYHFGAEWPWLTPNPRLFRCQRSANTKVILNSQSSGNVSIKIFDLSLLNLRCPPLERLHGFHCCSSGDAQLQSLKKHTRKRR